MLAGIGRGDVKARQALTSVKERLTPAYSAYRIELGEISSYPRGYKENGGIICHVNPLISIVNAVVGNDEEAFAVYKRTCPAYLEEKSDIRKVESFVDVSQYLLGVRPTLDGLAIEPHLPTEFNELTIGRTWRGVTYRISMKRTGRRSVSLDGHELSGGIVPPQTSENPVDVTVTF